MGLQNNLKYSHVRRLQSNRFHRGLQLSVTHTVHIHIVCNKWTIE